MTLPAVGTQARGFAGTRERDRILQVMARFVGVGYLAYFLISIPGFGAPPGLVARWFTPVGIVLAFGPGFCLLIAGFFDHTQRPVRVLLYLAPVGYLAAGLLWFVAWSGEQVAVEQVTWLMTFSGLPAIAIALLRLRLAGAVLVVCATLAAIITGVGRASTLFETSIVCEAAWGVLFTSPFMLGSHMMVRTGRVLDETRADAMAAAAESASAAARNAERSRFDGLIHDRVIATLVAATAHPDDARLAEQARETLAELGVLADGHADSDTELSIAETLARLRTVATSIDADVPFEATGHRGLDRSQRRYPESVVRAMGEAMGEALRNSVLHAGPNAERAVLVESTDDALQVSIADNGVGFDLDGVPPERLGIQVSIRSRLAEQPGGSAQIRSAPGRGTRVDLGWEAQR